MKKNYAMTLLFLLGFLASIPLYAQQTIKGKVTSQEDGMPLPGVSIVVQGSSKGTVSDLDGNYSISVPGSESVLVYSFIGYETQRKIAGNTTEINIQLAEDVSQLGEVVVTALGITRDERSIGYATQEVKGENLTYTKEQNVLGSLSGKIAGVQVTGSSGASMGGTQKIKIRGVNSISGGGEPLMVVDGTPISNSNFSGSSGQDYGNLGQDINPEDIETINVLKGPAASALYGIRGQYGVIMITTKKGKKGSDVKVELNSAVFVDNVSNLMPYQNLYGGGSSQTWRTLPNGDKYVDMSVDESWGPKTDGTLVRQVMSFYPQDPTYGQLTPFVAYPDNIKDYYETGTNVNNGVTITGGGASSNFRVSLNDTRIQGVEPNTSLKRNNVGVSLGVDLTKKLRLSTNVNYAANQGRRPGQGSEDGSRYLGQWFQRSMDMKRLKDYKYDDGTFLNWNLRRPSTSTGEVTNFNPLYWANPYFLANENFSDDNRDRFFGDVGLSYQISSELKVSAFVRSDMYTQNINSRASFGGTGNPGYSVGKYQNTEMNYELLAQYNKVWNKFSLDANVGGNIYDRDYSYLSMATVGGLSSPGFYNINASIDRPVTSSYQQNKQIKSAYAMVSLGYNNTYFLDASLRNDNSSTLPVDNNSYWYPSLSTSVVFSEWIKSDVMTLGKLRLSYAQAGSDLSPYSTTSFFNVGSTYTGSSTVNTLSVPDNLNNPNIKPSFAHSYEAGVDFKFYEGRVGLSFTYYNQRNENQILNLDISGTSGYGSATINAGEIVNRGLEIALTATPFRSDNFNWDMSFNISRNRNEVVELYPGIDVYQYGSTTYSSTSSYLNSYVGKPFGSLVGQAYQRDEATGKILLGSNNLPLYTDATHDFGTVLPDFNGGFQNVLNYKNFQLAAMIDFQAGGQFFSRSKMLAVRTGLDPLSAAINDKGMNVRDPLADGGGVKVEGISAETGEDVTAYVDAKAYYGVVARRIYEDWLYDASYIRLREVSLSYNFNKSQFANLPVENVKVALVGRNLGMLFQNAPKGINPAELSTGSQAIGWYESGQLPSVRSFGFNLNVTF
ncbi:SusC/RagA family TonB-linked outer membrane protein [Algoriphagus aquimarinus]|uniref:TonB-linked outer membrane protein, SusC/RagA family n=1 Tax=Algoriphagus aquimarinus TaxID=237018 RepID=A0A1I0XLG4_9BACT|nr:SusC/RagA family TonB-linked outer membrane protein [Algoriphagus aquimarinus]SFB01841.1 TonB-linked outer membrane protein, SusC/RagA family [Algoriphagus aquimarinus]